MAGTGGRSSSPWVTLTPMPRATQTVPSPSSPRRSERMPAIFLPPTSRSLGHLRSTRRASAGAFAAPLDCTPSPAGSRPSSPCGAGSRPSSTSAAARPPASGTQVASSSVLGTRIDSSRELFLGASHWRPRRPRPRVWKSATTEVKGRSGRESRSRQRLPSSSFVEVVSPSWMMGALWAMPLLGYWLLLRVVIPTPLILQDL